MPQIVSVDAEAVTCGGGSASADSPGRVLRPQSTHSVHEVGQWAAHGMVTMDCWYQDDSEESLSDVDRQS